MKKKTISMFYDEGYIFTSNIEPEKDESVTFRLRTEHGDVERAFLCLTHKANVVKDEWMEFEMTFERTDENQYFDYFILTLPPQEAFYWYCFRGEKARESAYCIRSRVSYEVPSTDECWMIHPGSKTPDWAKGVIWYSIMPDAYYNGDTSNDEPFSLPNFPAPWNTPHHTLCDKYGGDLKGIEKKLDYLKELGVGAIATNPIFRSSQNAGYGPEFFSQIEHSFGNAKFLQSFAEKVHEKGMKYLVDIVFAFVQSKDIWFNHTKQYPLEGVGQNKEHPYREMFIQENEDNEFGGYRGVWGGIALNHSSKILADELYKEPNSFLQYYCSAPFHVDALRYDCGGALYGIEEDGSRLEEDQVVGRMRPYLKKINPDILMLSEYSPMYSGAWDTRWNLPFRDASLKYVDGKITQSEYSRVCEESILNIPRSIGLCSYNQINDHDTPRVQDKPYYMLRAAQLVQMTMVGAPCIYYGEEINISREEGTFYAMEWDESNWDFNQLNFVKSLTELRKCNTAVHRGVLKNNLIVDDENCIYAFGRFDENGAVVTVASQNNFVTDVSIEVRQLGAMEGSVFTDWLSGRQYVVKNGSIDDVDILPGGTILVEGTASSSYKCGYAITTIGNAEGSVLVHNRDCISFTECKAAINGTEDACVFANRDVFNVCSVTMKTNVEKGHAAMMVRDNLKADSAFVALTVAGNKWYCMVRTKDGAPVRRYSLGKYHPNMCVKLERNGANDFSISVTKTLGTDWEVLVEGIHADISNHAYAGFVGVSGTPLIQKGIVKSGKKPVTVDTFEHGVSAMFDYPKTGNFAVAKKKLHVTADGSMQTALTNSGDEDWTFKSEISFAPTVEGDYAGIICRQDEDGYVVAARGRLDGKQSIFLGRANAGVLIPYYCVPDTAPNARITIQLQRIGTSYTAIYKYKKNWRAIGEVLHANFSVERVGLVVNGETDASFHYACFGDAIQYPESVNAPRTPRKIKFDYEKMQEAQTESGYEIICGQWEYAHEGFVQKDYGYAQLAVSGKEFTEFKVDFTCGIEDGEGFVGVEFGKENSNTPFGDGYALLYTSTHELLLKHGEEVLRSAFIENERGEMLRITIDYFSDILAVYAGQDGQPLFILHDFKMKKGGMAYITQGVVGRIGNYLNATYHAPFYYSIWRPAAFSKNGLASCSADIDHCFVAPVGVALTDFVLRTKIELLDTKHQEAFAGISICGAEGHYTKNNYIIDVKLWDGRDMDIGIRENINVLQFDYRKIDRTRPVHDVLIIRKDSVCSVYVDGSKEPVMQHEAFKGEGGSIAFHTKNARASFSDIEILDLQPGQNPYDTKIFKKWKESHYE